MQGYLDVQDVARRLGVKPATVYIYTYRAQQRRLSGNYDPEIDMPVPTTRVGNSPVWDEKEFDEWDAKPNKRRS